MEASRPARRGRPRAAQTSQSTPAPAPPAGRGRGTAAPAPAVAQPDEQPPDAAATSFLQRAPLRRRLRYLRRRREVALRDLGGFVFEGHRQGERSEEALAEKLAALSAIEQERETLERALGDRRELEVLREPGISACADCQTLHGSDARFCPNCGRPLAPAGR
ncbi:MAG TPA: zinc ribbon domain-containing protein [Solirubrobacteraceae bacterium]|nr:zinc ribbon domain-containing protein [Solirubrobacteraceae bacterium]